VQPHGVRFTPDGVLLVPMVDAAGVLQNLQRIAPQRPADGGPDKRFLSGGRKSGLFHVIGQAEGATVLLLAEGYATAASVHEATGRPVVVVRFDAGNLKHVAEALRQCWMPRPTSHLRTRFTFRPWASAMAATDAPGCWHSARTCVLNSAP